MKKKIKEHLRGITGTPDIINGRIWKTLLMLSLPIIISNLFQTMYNLADAFWLGKLGKTALAAPTITFNVMFTIIALASGLAMGGMTLLAQYRGAGNDKMVSKVAGNTFVLIFLSAGILAALGYTFTPDILRMLQTPADAYRQTMDYMRITFIGMPFVFGYYFFQGVMQGYGNTITPMKLNAFTVVLNVILDPLLIFGIGPFPAMGVIGAGLATIFSQFLSALIGISLLLSGRYGIKLQLKNMVPKWEIISSIMKIGLPMSFSQAGTSLGFTLMMGLVNTFGTGVVSAFGVGNRIISLLVMPAMGLSQGSSIMVAQNMGADKPHRAERSVWIAVGINAGVIFVLTTLLFFFGGYVVKFFINDPAVIAIGHRMFKITSYSVLFFSIMIIFTGAFQGSGHTMPVFVMQMMRLWAFRLPFSYILSKTFNMASDGIFWGMFLSNILITIISFIWFRSGVWKKRIIKKTETPEPVMELIED